MLTVQHDPQTPCDDDGGIALCASDQPVAIITCDSMVGEGLDVGEVVVRTVFLQPSADILLSPHYYRPDQAGLGGASVVYPIGVT